MVGIIAEFSTYYWVLTVLNAVSGGPSAWSAIASFALYLAMKIANNYRIPLLSITVKSASGSVFDFIEWENNSALIRVRLSSGGGLRLSISLCTLVFAGTAALSLAGNPPGGLDLSKLPLLLAILSISALFYSSNSAYIKTMGVTVPVVSSVAYATLVNLAIWLLLGERYLYAASVLMNFTAVVLGCDILTIKWAVLSNTKSLVIGGLGLYDAVVLVPAVSYLASSIIVVSMKSVLPNLLP
ncbi:MAG: hypothetical protein RMH84_01535 [Sulfolobales archaeon]|nr:hypothetical protein [Sulfolobales archaeon]